jgi:hypothetical protein
MEGRCYCGKLRYRVEGQPQMRGQCHCRECQYLSGGAPNIFLVMAPDGFRYLQGQPKHHRREDLPNAVTREFCADFGTHIASRRPDSGMLILKAGTLDDPNAFGPPQVAIFTCDKQPFHHIPEGMPNFDKLPSRPKPA